MFFHYSWVGLYQRLNFLDGPLIEILGYFALTNLYLVSYHLYIISSERRIPQTTPSSQSEKRLTTERVLSTLANEIARDAIGGIRKTQSASSSPNISMFNSAPTSAPLTYKLGMLALLPPFHRSPDKQTFRAQNCDYFHTCPLQHVFWLLKRTISMRRFF